MAILVTDGDAYVGSHICVELLQMGYDIIVINDTYRLLIARQTEAKMKKIKIIGWELLILQGMVSIGFPIFLGQSELIPKGIFTGILLGVIMLFCLSAFFILWKDKKVQRIIGMSLSVLTSAGLIAAFVVLSPAVDMLQKISMDYDEMAKVSVYVRAEDPAQSIEAASSYSFGILDALDRENTDAAVSRIEERLGTVLTQESYESVTVLAEALEEEMVDAIILNQSLLSILDELEGYENFRQSIREISSEQVIIEKSEQKPSTEITENSAFTVYISGIDGWGEIDTAGRSDVNIIATVNPETRQILLVSTPRDYFVELPVSNGAKDKLTHAGIYGVDCSKGALEQLYGIEIDYYFRMNFSGFESIIDSIGGIDVDSDYDFTVEGWHYQVGTNHLDGLSALAFARERYTLPGGDLARGENQIKIIQATLNKCMSPAILNHYTEVLDSMEGSVQTNLPYSYIASLVRMQLEDGREWNIQSYGVSGISSFSSTYSIPNQSLYVMIPDMDTVEEAQRRMQQVINDEFLDIPAVADCFRRNQIYGILFLQRVCKISESGKLIVFLLGFFVYMM